MSLIKGNHAGLGGSGAPGGALGSFYDHAIDQSLKLDDASGAYLTIASASPTATNRKKVTISCWVKRSQITDSGVCTIFHGAGNGLMMQFLGGSNTDQLYLYESPWQIISDRLFRDAGAWMHFALILDSTQSTDSDRSKLYINGELQDLSSWTVGSGANRYPALNYQFTWHTGSTMRIGSVGDASDLGGYLADFISIDGQNVSISDLGETKDGVWVPKDVSGLTLGDAGFYLKFDNSSDIGNDSGSNNIDFNATNLAASDVVPDSPTLNYCNIVPMLNTSLSEGNLKLTTSRTGNWDGTIGSFGVTSGKWYHEVRFSKTETNFRCVAGWIGNQASQTVTLHGKGGTGDPSASLFDNYAVTSWLTTFYKDGGTNGTMTAPSSGDVINIAADFDNGKIYFGINGTYYANDGGTDGNPAAGTNESLSGIDLTASEYVPFFQIRSDGSAGGNVMIANFGQEGTFAGTETAGGNSDANGVGDFFSAVPSGFLALASSSLPDITIGPGQTSQADDNFNTVLYTGDGSSSNAITVGFQPDWTWIKQRDGTPSHALFDSVRGADNVLRTNGTEEENNSGIATATFGGLTSFDSNGFTVDDGSDGTFDATNGSSDTYVAWNWKAGGSASSNSDGSITSSVSVNSTAKFSIGTYTGNGTVGATVGHGLGVAPNFLIIKNRSAAQGWPVKVVPPFAGGTRLQLESTAASTTESSGSGSLYNATNPSSSVITLGNQAMTNTNTNNYVFYAFADVDGYCKSGSYVGNGNADGTFVYTGFRPAFLLIGKTAVGGGWNWQLRDSVRGQFNVDNKELRANSSAAESSSAETIDFLSNGFKPRSANGSTNENTYTYIYLAFAEAPFKFANAR